MDLQRTPLLLDSIMEAEDWSANLTPWHRQERERERKRDEAEGRILNHAMAQRGNVRRFNVTYRQYQNARAERN